MLKPKLAILINALETGGAEKVVNELLSSLCNTYNLHLILLNNKIDFELSTNQISIHSLCRQPPDKKASAKSIFAIPGNAISLKKYLEKNQIPLCFSVLNRANFTNCCLKLLKWKGTVIISERSHTSKIYTRNTLAGKIGQWLVKTLYPKADVIVPNSHGIKKDLEDNFGLKSRIEVINNPVNIAAISQQKPATGKSNIPPFIFCSVGRLQKEKNHALLVRAAALLPSHDFKIQIVGGGAEKAALEQLITQLQLQNKVQLLGNQPNVPPFLYAANAFILPSNFEGFPNAVLEAMACALPVISTDCPSGPSEILAENYQPGQYVTACTVVTNGMLVPVNNEQEMARAMQQLMEQPQLQAHLAHQSYQRALCYNTPVIMQQFVQLFNRFLPAT